MSKDIRIKKGLNINLVGAAEQTTSKAVLSNVYAIKLEDFHGITPKMLAKQGAEVKAGKAVARFECKDYGLIENLAQGVFYTTKASTSRTRYVATKHK